MYVPFWAVGDKDANMHVKKTFSSEHTMFFLLYVVTNL